MLIISSYLLYGREFSLSLLHFMSLCGALVVLVLVFLAGLSCTAYMADFLALRVLYVVVLGLFHFCSWPSLLNPFLAMMSFAGYFHARFLLSAFFSVFLSCFVLFFLTVFVPDLFWCNFLYLETAAGFVVGQLIM